MNANIHIGNDWINELNLSLNGSINWKFYYILFTTFLLKKNWNSTTNTIKKQPKHPTNDKYFNRLIYYYKLNGNITKYDIINNQNIFPVSLLLKYFGIVSHISPLSCLLHTILYTKIGRESFKYTKYEKPNEIRHKIFKTEIILAHLFP
jgi:hypothetical protein